MDDKKTGLNESGRGKSRIIPPLTAGVVPKLIRVLLGSYDFWYFLPDWQI